MRWLNTGRRLKPTRRTVSIAADSEASCGIASTRTSGTIALRASARENRKMRLIILLSAGRIASLSGAEVTSAGERCSKRTRSSRSRKTLSASDGTPAQHPTEESLHEQQRRHDNCQNPQDRRGHARKAQGISQGNQFGYGFAE